ncbi:MAG TPA: primosomal protein N' [Nitrospiraceae bacterium]|nr:primosomal protein N' [Nitrospiraceae bacterium]
MQSPLPHTESKALFADVIVPRHLAGPFTYTVPSSLQPMLRIGHRVLVPFGQSILQGAVIALSDVLPQGLDQARLKEIRSVLPEGAPTAMSSNLFQLSRLVSEEYVAPWGQCLRLVLPPVPKSRTEVSQYELTEQGRAVLAAREHCSKKERALLTRLEKKSSRLRRAPLNPASSDLLQDLKIRGWVVEVQGIPPASAVPLTEPTKQATQDGFGVTAPLVFDSTMPWSEPLFNALRGQGPSHVLVQAPWTNRLKLLQQAVRLVLDRGQTILIIVGEAERAQWVAGLIRNDEASISPICFYSGLSDKLKAEMWDQIHRQIVRVVVGTRSAIFLPLTAIGAIWVEGEEDAALKEPQEPRYHARDVAWLRAQNEQAVLVLSSAHPSLETRAAVGQRGIVVQKSESADARPSIQIVELRDHRRGTVLSQPLIQAIEQAISRRAGVLLFLNRKGYAGAIVCRDCGQVPRCTSCCVTLMYSRHAGRLLCSYCGNRAPIPDICVSCSGPHMQLIGEGTERVEEDAKRLFPDATVIRLDRDTTRRPAQAEALWQKVARREWDIIVGTQLLLHRAPLPTMGLVGIVQADAGLNVPNFRSAERTYHTLLDAISLADSAGAGGQVVVQTYLSSHHAIRAVVENDESVFLSEELSHRAALGYPPAVHLIALLVSGANEKMVHEAATTWGDRLTACDSSLVEAGAAGAKTPPHSIDRLGRLTVLGPVPSPVRRLRGRYRWQILVKSSERETGLGAVRITVKEMERTYQRRAIKFDVDVDPIELW